ncbi:MAG: hypothetical protein AAFR54_22105, partial [Planctomycetota bacterium]
FGRAFVEVLFLVGARLAEAPVDAAFLGAGFFAAAFPVAVFFEAFFEAPFFAAVRFAAAFLCAFFFAIGWIERSGGVPDAPPESAIRTRSRRRR